MDFTARLTNTLYNRMLALVAAWAGLALLGVLGSLPAHLG